MGNCTGKILSYKNKSKSIYVIEQSRPQAERLQLLNQLAIRQLLPNSLAITGMGLGTH
jgi:hypothetical protein